MRTAALVVRILVGLGFLITGVNHFYKFMETPKPPSDAAKQFVTAMATTEYMTVVKVLEVVGGLLLVSGFFVPLGTVLLLPVAVNIALYELVFAHQPGPGVVLTLLLAVVVAGNWAAFRGLLLMKVPDAARTPAPTPLAAAGGVKLGGGRIASYSRVSSRASGFREVGMETCPDCHADGPCPACAPPVAGGAVTVVGRPRLDDAPAARSPTPPASPRLVVLRGELPGTVFPLLPGRNTLGRAGERPVDIELSPQEHAERTWTSRQHACVRLEAGQLIVDDLMSLNGTFLNGSRVHPGQPRPARAGDVLQVGTIQMRVEVG